MNCLQKKIVFLCLFAGLMLAATGLSAQNPSSAKRFNLAVYATGTQDDNALTPSLLTIIQNRAITKLTSGGSKYQLIERSNDFLKQIQSEQKMQSSGEVADGQIAEIGAGYGAEKICVVSVTIVEQYLYIATRIVDVATKTSFESGDAVCENYNSKIPELMKTLENSLDKMLGDAVPSSNVSSKVQDSEIKDFEDYKKKQKEQRGAFLDPNSLAYKEYKKYREFTVAGAVLTSVGTLLAVPVGVPLALEGIGKGPNSYYDPYLTPVCVGGGVLFVGIVIWGLAPNHLKKSYGYYINGEQHTASFNIHPYLDRNNTFGAGITLQF